LQWLVDHSFPFLVVSDLGITRQGEIFSKGVPLEAVVSKNATEVWVTLEENSEQVPSFTLIPVSPSENRDNTRNGVRLSGIGLNTNSSCLGEAEEVIHDLKPLVALRVVSTTDINATLELALRVVPQEDENGNNCARGNMEREFVLINRELLNKFGKALHKVGSVCVKGLGSFGMFNRCRIRGGGFGEGRDRGFGR